MNRVRTEYAKAVVAALAAVLLLALGIGEHTLDTAGLTVLSGALCGLFVRRARTSGRIAARRTCGQVPRT